MASFDLAMAFEEEEEEEAHLQAALLLLALAGEIDAREERAARRNPARLYLTRADLPHPRGDTPWQHLLAARNDRAFITTMGFDVATFELVLESGFEENWNTATIDRRDVDVNGAPRLGRRSLNAAGGLGLVLHYINSCMTETSLQQIFGLVPATVGRYINFAMHIYDSTLARIPDARVVWPDAARFAEYEAMIVRRHPLLVGAGGSLDGLNCVVEVPDDPEMENASYNAWTHGHYSSQIFAFAPDGVIIEAVLNAPGSWHDSRIARPVYDRLANDTPEGVYLVADTAFPRGTARVGGRIKAPLKQGQRLPSDFLARTERLAFDRQLLSYRQTAEWGMRAIQGGFGRLRVPLTVDPPARLLLLRVITRSYNLRTRRVGLNQIRAVYCDIWRQAEGDEIWDGFADMMFGELRRRDRVSRFHTTAVEQSNE